MSMKLTRAFLVLLLVLSALAPSYGAAADPDGTGGIARDASSMGPERFAATTLESNQAGFEPRCSVLLNGDYQKWMKLEIERLKTGKSFFRRSLLSVLSPGLRTKVMMQAAKAPSPLQEVEVRAAIRKVVRDVERMQRRATGAAVITAMTVGTAVGATFLADKLPGKTISFFIGYFTSAMVKELGYSIWTRIESRLRRFSIFQTELPPEGSGLAGFLPRRIDSGLEATALKQGATYTPLETEGNSRLRTVQGWIEGRLASILASMNDPDPDNRRRLTIDELAYLLIERRLHYEDIPIGSNTVRLALAFKFLNRAQLTAEVIPEVLERVKEMDDGAKYDSTILRDDEQVLRVWFEMPLDDFDER